MRPFPGLLILGTDTGVGKTQVTAALVHALRARGLPAVGLKPIETGCGDGLPADALLLARASGQVLPLDQVCLYRYTPPIAPAAAAQQARRPIVLGQLVRHIRRLQREGYLPVVETAGGLYTPVTGSAGFERLGRALDFPALLVARSGLGTINHSLLTLRAARHEGLRVLGVVLNRSRPSTSPDETDNARLIARSGQVLVMGPLPYLRGTPVGRYPRLAALLEADGTLDRLLSQAEAGEKRVE